MTPEYAKKAAQMRKETRRSGAPMPEKPLIDPLGRFRGLTYMNLGYCTKTDAYYRRAWFLCVGKGQYNVIHYTEKVEEQND